MDYLDDKKLLLKRFCSKENSSLGMMFNFEQFYSTVNYSVCCTISLEYAFFVLYNILKIAANSMR